MAGRIIKKLLFIFTIILLINCEGEHQNEMNLDSIIVEYIDQELKDFNSKKSVLSVSKDLSNISYSAYRIAMFANLLDLDALPNKAYIHNDIKIAHFIEKMKNEKELVEIKSFLQKNNFYNTDSIYFNSNFPEWVVLNNKKTGKYIIIKDMWYHPLDSIVKRYKYELE